MKRNRLLAASLASVLSVSLLAGCGGGSANTDTPATKAPAEGGDKAPAGVTLNIVTSYGGDDGNRTNYEAAIKAYEAESGNKVSDASATSNEEWKAKVLTDFQTGTEPDVLFFFTNADAEPFIEAGKVVSIDTIRETYPDYADNMKDDMMAVAADGENYAVPASGFWENLFVNKTVLDAAGVDMPGADYTWDQFLADCQAIKDAGYTPIGASLAEVPHYWFEFAVLNNGNIDQHLTAPTLDDSGALVMDATAEAWIGGLNDIKELFDLGYFPGNTLTTDDASTVQMVVDGQAAFLIDGSWKVGYFTENAADLNEFAITNVPGKGDRPASEVIGGISMGYFITEKAWADPAKQAAAVELVSHLTSDETMSTFVTTEVTALKNGASPAGLNELQQSAADANANVSAVVGAVQDTITSECKTDLFANVPHIVSGTMTAEEAIVSALALN